MRAKITEALVDRTPYTSGGTKWIYDTDLRGFSLAVGKTVKTYYAASEASGRSLRVRVGHTDTMSVKEARERAAAMLVDLRRGILPKPATTETLAAALETYLARRRVKATTARQYKDAINLYLKAWLNRDISSLTRADVDQRHRSIGKRAPYASNQVFRILRAIMRDAIKRGVIDDDPTVAVSWFTERRRDTRIGDLQAWWQAVDALENPIRRAYYRVVLFTGHRRNEIACLRWDDLDLGDAPTMSIRNPKRGKPYIVPLARQAAEVLRDLRPVSEQVRAGTPWCFPAQSRSKHIEEPTEASVPGGIHDLRREWLSTAAEEGVPLILAKAAIGHSLGGDVTTGYMTGLDVRAVVQSVADAIERRAGPVVVKLAAGPRAA